jgi:hypothetical protein
MSTTVRLIAGYTTSGRPSYEEVHVEALGSGKYRLLQSPGLTIGLAAGDELTVDENGKFELVYRGGNVCIQIFSEERLDDAERFTSQEIAKIGGRLDGRASKELVYTVSAKAGFPAIERVLYELKRRFPALDWYFGNVYDPVDGVTPLNWWFDT